MSDDREKNGSRITDAPLCLDEIVRGGLGTQRLGAKFHYFDAVDSTNSRARSLAREGAPEGEVVIAERQSAGRGRLGRSWVSPPYANLYLSLILRPTLAPPDAPQVTLMAAVAVADSVAAFSPEPPVIKWPNDILVDGRKLAGILTESACDSERIEFVILGIGVNVNFPRRLMPPAIRARATSLMEVAGQPVDRERFLRRLIQDLDRCYGTLEESGFAALAPRWQARFGLEGKRVRAEAGDGTLIGTAVGIDRDGALLVADERGALRRVVAGDVTALEED